MSEVDPNRGNLRRVFLAALGIMALPYSPFGFAYGPEGHLIAGRVAEDGLCTRASLEVAALAGGEDLGEIGTWADRIRSDPAYSHAAPWHFVNIADADELSSFEHPPEGDVLWGIEYFSSRLSDDSLSSANRSEALRFLVHFIVDIHQPLHVGLAVDRGGNSIDLMFRGEETNLHRFWDTHAIDWTGLSVGAYTRLIRRDIAADDSAVSLDPLDWAAESLALRSEVYAFGQAGREPDRAYLEFAAATTRERLSLAARRLAAVLNEIYCR